MNTSQFDSSLALAFSEFEPGDGQRWSTWPGTQPSERGPEPRPSWLVTSAAAVDTELGILKTGKEADVHLVERAVPDEPPGGGGDPAVGGAGVILAAKRYRGSDRRDFHRSGEYQEGRTVRRSRDQRAIERGSSYGRGISAAHWAYAEFDALSRLYRLGAPVPYPVQISDTELLMQFIGSGREAAPRLQQSHAGRGELAGLRDQVIDFLRLAARAGFAHGDLSPYNMLVHEGRVWVIDLPQIVDLAANPNGLDFLHRDCVNVLTWFERRGLPGDPDELFADLLGEVF
ncbi:serine protein kinase RIO [Microbacterium sp. DT81.1]|uniref:serine protein kinase RIO n=1 Tax=Microbacterium sp. DT81.1 TaxID=3393413 RepID=UPI003CEB36A9